MLRTKIFLSLIALTIIIGIPMLKKIMLFRNFYIIFLFLVVQKIFDFNFIINIAHIFTLTLGLFFDL